MAVGRHFEKPLNCYTSATVQRIAVKFVTMTHFNPPKPTHDQNFDLKNPRWRTAAVLKNQIIAISQQWLTDRHEFLHDDAH